MFRLGSDIQFLFLFSFFLGFLEKLESDFNVFFVFDAIYLDLQQFIEFWEKYAV